jgi:hypothetical protein
MKMTRDQLKKIIKECLVEILMDGAGEALHERAVPRQQSPGRQSQYQQPSTRRQTVFDMMQVRQPQQQPQRPQASQINEMVGIATKDPIMAAILADTAQTTLLEQESNGRIPTAGGDQAQRVMSAYNPTEIFGEEAQARWNEAAFAPRNRLPGMSVGNFDMSPDYDPYASVKKA